MDGDDLTIEPHGDALKLGEAGVLPDGYTTICLPPGLLCMEDRLLWQRVRMRAMLGLPPENEFDHLLRETLAATRQLKGGQTVKVAAVLAAVRLAIAKTHGIRIRTHPRGVALHLGMRYQTLLAVRGAAERVIKRDSIHLSLPDWLNWEWS